MIEVKELQKSYGDKIALKGISFRVEPGEIFGFLGPNGAGKTTTLKILTGQMLPSYGQARILGKDVVSDPAAVLTQIGIVPEKANLYERLTIVQNLEFFSRLYGCEAVGIDRYLEQVGLLGEKNTQVKKLSKGMKQKVLLVRALLHNPKVLFLDEPSSGLDPTSAAEIHQILLKLNREGVTILLTSHNMEEVDKLCSRIAFLDHGTIVEMGSTGELKLKYADNRMRVLLRSGNRLEERHLALMGEQSAEELAQWIREGSVASIHSCEPTLADIFTKLTGREIA